MYDYEVFTKLQSQSTFRQGWGSRVGVDSPLRYVRSNSTRCNLTLPRFDRFLKSLDDQSQPGMRRDQREESTEIQMQVLTLNLSTADFLSDHPLPPQRNNQHTPQRLEASFSMVLNPCGSNQELYLDLWHTDFHNGSSSSFMFLTERRGKRFLHVPSLI